MPATDTATHAPEPGLATDSRAGSDADTEADCAEHRPRPWLTAMLALGLGALIVFAVVALVVPQDLTDPSGRKAKIYATSHLERPTDLTIDGPSDVLIFKIVISPGKAGGWHEHRGYSLVSVVSGQATFYERNDPKCRPHRFDPGESQLEHRFHPNQIRNEGTVPLVMMVVELTPQGRKPERAVTANPRCPS